MMQQTPQIQVPEIRVPVDAEIVGKSSPVLSRQVSIGFPIEEWLLLRKAAADRQIPITELCRRLMEAGIWRLGQAAKGEAERTSLRHHWQDLEGRERKYQRNRDKKKREAQRNHLVNKLFDHQRECGQCGKTMNQDGLFRDRPTLKDQDVFCTYLICRKCAGTAD